MINKNLCNPIPIHWSKNDWYSNKKTYHGVCRHPIAPVGRILPMQLTFGSDDFSDNFRANVRCFGFIGESSFWEGHIDYKIETEDKFTIRNQDYTLMFAKGDTDNAYNISCTVRHGGYRFEFEVYDWNADYQPREYNVAGTRVGAGGARMPFSGRVVIANILFDRMPTQQQGLSVHDYATDAVVWSGDADITLDKLRDSARRSDRYYGGYIREVDTGIRTEGLYYISMTFQGHTYYSEPFLWKRVENCVRIEYKRNTPIVTAENGLVFGGMMQMYLDGEIMSPEYKYNTEVEELDGCKFVRKRVSYKQFKFSTLCTDYMVEAIRLLWHCDYIKMVQHGEEYMVDYMEAPEPSWHADNHIAEVSLKFETDTIMQTNGESSENMRPKGQVFDGSFDRSFDNSFDI